MPGFLIKFLSNLNSKKLWIEDLNKLTKKKIYIVFKE